jgi:hypothetical protein
LISNIKWTIFDLTYYKSSAWVKRRDINRSRGNALVIAASKIRDNG